MKNLFVYGTLKKGYSRHYLFEEVLGHKVRTLPATIYGKMYNIGNFPAVIEGSNLIHGELIELNEKDYNRIIVVLDIIESVQAGLYKRVEVDTHLKGDKVKAETYLFSNLYILNNIQPAIIENGKW